MRKVERILLRFLVAGILTASCVPTAWAQADSSLLAIRGGTIHTLAGPPIENGTVLIRDGQIAAVGTDVDVPAGTKVIEATGLHVYPGLFDPLSRLGLTEVGQVSATVDINELGEFNPQLVAAEPWTHETLEMLIAKVCQSQNAGMNKVAQPIRVAVSGTTISPTIHDTLVLLGKEKTLNRIRRALTML